MRVFPAWLNNLRDAAPLGLIAGVGYVVLLVTYGAGPRSTDVGYMPDQPVPYSHALHAGKLGLDCRYCHTTVEHSAHASIPPTQTCMNCHTNIRLGENGTKKLPKIWESYETGKPVEWVRIHDLPDYAYFNHSAHVRRGVGCVSCHGRVDRMEVVYQDQPLSMSWCLDCHRNPDKHLRPVDQITNMAWVPDGDPLLVGQKLREEYNIKPSTDCSTCHR